MLDTKAPSIEQYLGSTVHLLPQTNLLRALHTVIRDRNASRDDFVFYSGRIIRLLVETALDMLPFEACAAETPVGARYDGLRFDPHICGVSVARAGESMEAGLRAVCRSVRIGKILIQRDKKTKLPRLYYAAFPADIARATSCSWTPCWPPAAPRWPPSGSCSTRASRRTGSSSSTS